MLNIGIVGLGHVAKHQISALERCGEFHLMAVCDPDPSRLSLLDRSVPSFSCLEDMLKLSYLDVVVVATPNRLHVDQGTMVMEAGKWLVMEKPLAETKQQFEKFSLKKEELSGNCTQALHAAFGLEVDWLYRQQVSGQIDFPEVTSFLCEFYDPYVACGTILPQALSLGGSWLDSGINALSVIGKFVPVDSLVITHSQMRRGEELGCSEVQGNVRFRSVHQVDQRVGSIETNWTKGRDKKRTTLCFNSIGHKIILDHSEQQVILRDNNSERLLFACDNGLPRLTNHYMGVFKDVADQIAAGKDNFEYCKQLHRLLFQAESWVNGIEEL